MTTSDRAHVKRWAIAVGLVVAATAAQAQPRRPKAEVTPLAAADGVHAGGSVRLALRVSLPEDVHVQSDKPRDPFLIPTALTLELPTGVAAVDIVYPEATNLVQSGQPQPLAVFEHDFVIGVQLSVARSVPLGEQLVTARLRYQACDVTTCYPPAREETRWTLRIVADGTAIAARDKSVFDRIPFLKLPPRPGRQ